MDIFLYIQSKANGDIGTVNGNGNGNNYGNTTKSTQASRLAMSMDYVNVKFKALIDLKLQLATASTNSECSYCTTHPMEMFTSFDLLLSYTWLSQIAFHAGFQLDF